MMNLLMAGPPELQHIFLDRRQDIGWWSLAPCRKWNIRMVRKAEMLNDLLRVAAPVHHQHQGSQAPQQPMRDNRRGLREGQRKIVFRNAAHRFRKLIPERNRERNGTAVAAGPRVRIGPEAVDPGQEVGGHSYIAVPDMVEADVPDVRPQPLQSLRDGVLDPYHLVARAD